MVEAQKLDICEIGAVVDEWITKWQDDRLSYCDIISYWCTRIPKCEYDSNTMCSKYDEVFICALEKFIFYDQSPEYIEEVYQRSQKSVTCCKVLDSNDIIYTCLDCKLTKNLSFGLCVECFNNSEHRFHRYQFRESELGTDMCCCGQTENWKTVGGCSKHLVSDENTDLLPKELTSRAAVVIEAILRYNADVIDQEEYIPEEDCWDRDFFCTVLYNYDIDVHDILEEVPLDGDVIMHIQHLEKETATIYQYGSKERCEAVVSKTLQKSFNVFVIHAHEALKRNFAVRLLQYLEKILKYGKEFRKIFTKLLTKPLSLHESFLEKYFTNTMNFPLKFQFCCLQLLVSGTLKEYQNKKIITKEIMTMYGKLSKQSIYDNSTNFGYYTNYLFSDPTLTTYLMEENFALTVFYKSIWENTEIHDMWELKIGEDLEKDYVNEFEIFTDIIYHVEILTKSEIKEWTTNFRTVFLDGLSYFLKILSKMQESYSYIRETTRYNNKSYTIVLNTQDSVGQTIADLLRWCVDDNGVLMEAYKATMIQIKHQFLNDFNKNTKIIYFLNHSAKCLSYDSKTQSASFCLPLTRFLAGLILAWWERYPATFNSIEFDTLKSIVVPLIDPILKLHVMIAQEFAGLWKMNGRVLLDNLNQYRDDISRSEILDRDIQVLQISASLMDPNKFLIHILNKYDLVSWAERNFEENLKSTDDEETKVVICIAEQFLKLLINVITERYIPEVGYVSKKDRDKNEVIHSLCIKSRSRSQLKNCFYRSDLLYNPIDVVDNVINEVAIFKTLDDQLYELKETFYDQYNPYFYHYTPEEMMEAQECQEQRRKIAKIPEFIPPPVLPKLKKSFSSIVNIFQSDVLLHIMQVILERSIDLNSKSYSYGQLQNVLYLIGFALLDQESGNYDFLSFVDKAIKWKIFALLEQVLTIERSDIPKGLIKWTLKKYYALAGDYANPTNREFEVSDENLEKKKILGAERRVKILEEMAQKRNQFAQNNIISDDLDECLPTFAEKTCLLCHETQNSSLQKNSFVVLGSMSFSTVLVKKRENTSNTIDYPLLSSNLGPAYFTSTCGHTMHLSCWKGYMQNSEDPSMNCPLCSNFCNIIFPLFPTLNQLDVENYEFDPDLKKLTTDFAKSFPNSQCENPLEVWKSLTYTIHVIETSMRDLNKPLLENFSSRNQASLEYLVGVAAAANFICIQDEPFKICINQIYLLLSGRTSDLGTILDFDMFGLLVVMILSKYDLSKILRMAFLAELVKILICTDFDGMNDENNQFCFDKQTPIQQILEIVSKEVYHLSDDFIWTYLQTACVPFLRCCVLFYKFLNDTPSPIELTKLGGDSFSNMCSYLGLPQAKEEIFGDQQLFSVMKMWCSHPGVVESLGSDKAVYSTAIPQLIQLPNEYSELVTKISLFRDCHGSDKFGITYKICLVCGKLVCSGSCCMELDLFGKPLPGHFSHMRDCGGVGLFLSIHQCLVIAALSPNMVVNIPAPYKNEYNENKVIEDSLLNRDPLKFSPKVYKSLHNEWLSHSILDKIEVNNIRGRQEQDTYFYDNRGFG